MRGKQARKKEFTTLCTELRLCHKKTQTCDIDSKAMRQMGRKLLMEGGIIAETIID